MLKYGSMQAAPPAGHARRHRTVLALAAALTVGAALAAVVLSSHARHTVNLSSDPGTASPDMR